MATNQATVSFDDIIQAGKHHSELQSLVLTFRKGANAKRRRSSRMTSSGKDDERNRNWQMKYLGEDEATTLQVTAVANLALVPALPPELV